MNNYDDSARLNERDAMRYSRAQNLAVRHSHYRRNMNAAQKGHGIRDHQYMQEVAQVRAFRRGGVANPLDELDAEAFSPEVLEYIRYQEHLDFIESLYEDDLHEYMQERALQEEDEGDITGEELREVMGEDSQLLIVGGIEYPLGMFTPPTVEELFDPQYMYPERCYQGCECEDDMETLDIHGRSHVVGWNEIGGYRTTGFAETHF